MKRGPVGNSSEQVWGRSDERHHTYIHDPKAAADAESVYDHLAHPGRGAQSCRQHIPRSSTRHRIAARADAQWREKSTNLESDANRMRLAPSLRYSTHFSQWISLALELVWAAERLVEMEIYLANRSGGLRNEIGDSLGD